jgi:hypothetical protein
VAWAAAPSGVSSMMGDARTLNFHWQIRIHQRTQVVVSHPTLPTTEPLQPWVVGPLLLRRCMITDSVPDLFDYRWPSADCERACSLSPRGHDAIGPGLRAKRHRIILVTMETSGHGFDKREKS